MGIFAGALGMKENWFLFFVHVTGTCAVFYIFFLWRMLGAGDIKLMALCVGMLGISNGVLVLFLGLLSASAESLRKLGKRGILWSRLSGLAAFVIQSGRDRKIREYPGRADPCGSLRLGPHLFLGYCAFLLFFR